MYNPSTHGDQRYRTRQFVGDAHPGEGHFPAHFRLKLDPPTIIDPSEKCEVDVKIYLPTSTWHVVIPD